MSRTEFTKKTKLLAFERARGHCEVCGTKIITSAEYDHFIPDALGGYNTLENCVCTCVKCHKIKTFQRDIPAIAKAVRLNEKRAGARKSGGFRKAPAGYKYSWKTGRMEKTGE